MGTRKPHQPLRQRLIELHSFPLHRKIAPKSHARQVSQASTFPTSPNSGTPQAPDIPSSPRNGIPDPPDIPTSPDSGILQPTVEPTNRHVRRLQSARPLSRGNVKDSRKPRYSALMNINQVKYFVAAYEQGSISTATRTQNVTAQAVPKAIGDLEKECGEKLFNRTNHGMNPHGVRARVLPEGPRGDEGVHRAGTAFLPASRTRTTRSTTPSSPRSRSAARSRTSATSQRQSRRWRTSCSNRGITSTSSSRS